MSDGVFTRMKRIEFVVKTDPDEVGDGTEYPMLVTLDEIAEILYRVRDAEWSAFSLKSKDGSGTYYRLSKTSSSKPVALVESNGDDSNFVASFSQRGYSTTRDTSDPDGMGTHPELIPMEDYGASYFSTEYQVGELDEVPADPNSTYENTIMNAREAIAERAIWASLPDNAGYEINQALNAYLTNAAGVLIGGFRTGFSYHGASWSDNAVIPSGYVPYLEVGFEDAGYGPFQGALVSLDFSGKVAILDNAGNGSPFDLLNELYLGVSLLVEMHEGGAINAFTATGGASYSPVDSGALLRLVLAGGEVTAKIFAENDAGNSEFVSCTDFILTATEWWPYARYDLGTATEVSIWDTETGAKL